MLEIIAKGERLQLPNDISIDMTWENPFLLQDRVPATYSMSFSLPPTPQLLRIFGYPNRVASTGDWEDVESRIIFNALTVAVGRLVLEEFEGDLKVSFVGSEIPPIVKEKMNLLELDFTAFGNGSRFNPNFNSGWAQTYKNHIFNNMADIGEKFAACPVRVTSEEWKYDENHYGNYNLSRLYLNMFNVAGGNYIFTGGAADVHATIFPQPYLHYLFDTIFGESLVANPFRSDSELKTLAMVTNFHPMFSTGIMSLYRGVIVDNSYFDQDNYFYLSTFFNKYPFNELLKNVLKMFCCSLMPRPDGRWDIVHNKAVLESEQSVDWNGKLVGDPVISKQRGKKYGYGYSGESPADEPGSIATVASFEALLAGGEGTYMIAATGEVWEKREVEEGVFEYDRKKSGLGGYDNGEEDDGETYSINSDVVPVRMRQDVYWSENSEVVRHPWFVPEFSGDRRKRDFAPMIGFVRGWYNVSTKQLGAGYAGHYPLMTPYAFDQNGNRVGDYSLAWEGEDGLIEQFHSEFKAYIERPKKALTGYFNLSAIDLRNLDYKKKVHIRGRNFYLQKIEAAIAKHRVSLCRCELIEA